MTQNSVDISEFDFEKLQRIRNDLETEVDRLKTAYGDLQMLKSKVSTSKECLKVFTESKKGQEVLVPLTPSMYVLGKHSNVERVTVDVGTGFFVEKTIKETDEYMDRRISTLDEQLGQVERGINVHTKNWQSVTQVMAERVRERQLASGAESSQ